MAWCNAVLQPSCILSEAALGQRMRWIRNGYTTRYVYCGERVLEENSYAGTVLAWHTPSSGSYYTPWLHMQRSGTGHSYPLCDGVGTVRMLVDGSAAVTDRYSLDAFGAEFAPPTGSTVNPYEFGGAWGYLTDSSGLEQLGHRFYWPEIGRFIQQDPIGDGVNWYAYAGNNPLRYIDPDGEVPVLAIGAGVVVVGGAVWAWTHPNEAQAALARAQKAIGNAARSLWTSTGETMPVPSTDYGRAAGSGATTVGVSIARTREAQYWIDEGLGGNDVSIEEIQAERQRWGRAAQNWCPPEPDEE